ncbi:hypothetical protein [Clostridium septicum]|uniref:Uncharacterized protein n=1 Tax=Clostridium septicum TaxID=1504 RepID=A0A9N7JMJ4_CLOSE|nr:hypothetical protein [Clostridium septicum]AYE34387.1 hypothetical protein CP523_08085 [Clostridium septicum]MDU1312552.1 hypothetical protein [Clostridium septicum]QAS59792.1 hypothetical protein EI377_02840 [Clostridium septicum]UEC20971.1 hypothetical protein LK444_00675 [Clostridium septicum]USS00980.1 hypothetical protein NH397_00420 [Clostridium septicum]
MKKNSGIFVKLNYKTIGEFKSLIIDRDIITIEEEKYLMCAGKYNKDGWTFVFKASSIKEAEELINTKSIRTKRVVNGNSHIIDTERVVIPGWI